MYNPYVRNDSFDVVALSIIFGFLSRKRYFLTSLAIDLYLLTI